MRKVKQSGFDNFYNYSMGKKRFFVAYEKEIVQSVLASLIVAFLLIVFELISYFLLPYLSNLWIIFIKLGLILIFISLYINYVQYLHWTKQK